VNPTAFSELLTDISDEFIDSAAEPQRKPVHWYPISAVAACIVLLISAAVYPKLRTQMPEIIAPPVSSAEITVTTTTLPEQTDQSETQTAASLVQSEVTLVTVTVNTTTMIAMVTAPTETNAITVVEPLQTAESSGTKLPQTDKSTDTEPSKTTVSVSTTLSQTTITYDTTAVPVPEPIPLWKGDVLTASGEWFELPEFACWFRFFPSEQHELLREEFRIPQDFDLTRQQCLLMTVQTGYADTAIIGCRYAQNGLILQIAYLETGAHAEQTMRYAIPIPEYLVIAPENCTAEFIAMTDETKYQALLTDSLYIENIE